MIISNYDSINKWYAIQMDKTLLYDQLCFGYFIESSYDLSIFATELELQEYVNKFYNDPDWYKNNKKETTCSYTPEILDKFINIGWLTKYNWRLSMTEDTSNLLNAKLLSLPGNHTNDTVVNIQDSSGDLRSLPVSDFVSLVFDYQQVRPVFMNVIKQIQGSFIK